jgi:hypothetical protein
MGSFKKPNWNQFSVNKADEAIGTLGLKAQLWGGLSLRGGGDRAQAALNDSIYRK